MKGGVYRMLTPYLYFAFLCVIFILTHKRNGLYRAVYPAELQLDVGLQNDEAECRHEMHGAGVVS